MSGVIVKPQPKLEVITNALTALTGAKIVKLKVEITPELYKVCPYVNVRKVEELLCLVNFHYNAGVLRRLAKEGKSEACFKKGTSWHQPIIDQQGRLTPFCKHKSNGQVYFRSMWLRTIACQYYAGSIAHPKPIDIQDIFEYLKERSNYANQGLTNPLVFLTYKLNSIKELTVDGQTYR